MAAFVIWRMEAITPGSANRKRHVEWSQSRKTTMLLDVQKPVIAHPAGHRWAKMFDEFRNADKRKRILARSGSCRGTSERSFYDTRITRQRCLREARRRCSFWRPGVACVWPSTWRGNDRWPTRGSRLRWSSCRTDAGCLSLSEAPSHSVTNA
jgi:hypothetical protein